MRTPLQKDEKILLVTYSSWVSLIVPGLILIGFCIVSYFIDFTQHWGWVAAVLGMIYFLIKYFAWKVNIWVVTNHRVIDENGLLSHYAKESPLEKINNISYDQGLVGRIFNFGHVEIQTAAETGATDYYMVNHPKLLKDTITQAQSEFNYSQAGNQARQMAAALGMQHGGIPLNSSSQQPIAEELEKLFALKQKGILSDEEYLKAKNKLLNN